MQFLVFITALLSTVAVAQRSSTVNRQCATRYSLKPTSKIRTTTYRATTTRTVGRTVVVDPRTTITQGGTTLFTTATAGSFVTVTAASSTDTFTSFQTVTSTSTITSTQSFTTATTVLSTVLVGGVTSTVPAPAGFTALGNTPGFTAKKRNALLERLEPHLESRANEVQGHIPIIAGAAKMSKRQRSRQNNVRREYPVGIQCTFKTSYFATRTSTVTGTGPTSTITISGATVVSTITVTTTGVVTVVPADATRTITVTTAESATTTSTSTFVTTLSATVTIQAPGATVLAQCAANNQISSAFAGNQIGTLTFNGDFTLQSAQVTDTTGYECCALCARTANCAGYAQAPAQQNNACFYVVTDGRCDATQTFGDTYNYYAINTRGYTVGNAQCGQLAPVAGPPRTGDFAPGAKL